MFFRDLFGRIGRLLGLEEDYDEYEYVEEQSQGEGGGEDKRRGKLVNLNTARQVRLTIAEPLTFDEVQRIADELKSRHAVIVNLESTDSVVSKRIIDFVSGLVYGLDGNMQKICEGIFRYAHYPDQHCGSIEAPAKDKTPSNHNDTSVSHLIWNTQDIYQIELENTDTR
jgi:cell division inhibitor SepF